MATTIAARPSADLKRLAEVCRHYGVRRLRMFGSAARGEMRPDSDIDLLADFRAGAHPTYFTLVAMSDELETVYGGGHRVDLVTEPVHPLIRRYIVPDLVTLYEEG